MKLLLFRRCNHKSRLSEVVHNLTCRAFGCGGRILVWAQTGHNYRNLAFFILATVIS